MFSVIALYLCIDIIGIKKMGDTIIGRCFPLSFPVPLFSLCVRAELLCCATVLDYSWVSIQLRAVVCCQI